MNEHDRDAAPSRAAIGGHPIHPMLVPFPIAAFVFVLLADLSFLATQDAFWARAAFWLLIAGIVSGAAAAVFGLIDFLGIPRARSLAAAKLHFAGNAVALLLAIWNVLRRWQDPAAGVLTLGLVLSAIVVLILIVTGWLGGELAYRYRIGVMRQSGGEAGQRQRAYSGNRPNADRT